MGRSKKKKFEHNDLNPLVIQPGKPFFEICKGRWHSEFFKNNNPITLELACGGAEYSHTFSQLFPERNFIGVDIKGNRFWKTAHSGLERQATNLGFLRTVIQNLENFFAENEINEIWIVFPDPRPKGRDEKRRLTHPRFIDIYKKLLKPGGIIHLKTDNTQLFEFSLEVIRNDSHTLHYHTFDLYQSEMISNHHHIVTRYEKEFLEEGRKIKYLTFSIKNN